MKFTCVRNWPELAAQAQYQAHKLAALVGMSPRHLERCFREHLRQTPQAWLAAQRFQRAAALLREGRLSAKEIAGAVGYDNGSAFGRAFKARFGCSPGAYQRRRRPRWQVMACLGQNRRKTR